MTRLRIAAAVTALSLWLTSGSAVAQTAASTRELRWDPALDLTLTAGGLAAWITSELLKGDIAPSSCRWCSVDPVDASVRDALVWHDTALADTLSNVTGIVLLPLSAIGLDALAAAHDGALRGVPEDALLIAEAAVVAADVNQLTKLIAGRERPFVHALVPEQKSRTPHPSDNNLSFFSGHSSEAFALATASSTVGTMRGYRWAPLAWSVGEAMAATTAYLRIAADKHWLTDVVVGAVVGAGIGFAVPYVFHSAVDDPPRIQTSAAARASALPIGTALTIAW
jgi:membrane-associated phospholipid phosphatase